MKTQFDIESLNRIYIENVNYKVVNGSCRQREKRIILFFSGNGLYFPNTDEVFQQVIIENNRFEWENIAKSLNHDFHKLVFVRDIQKTWYTEGISNTVPSIDALHLLLKELTQDYNKIICVGNSAGGYAAMLFGALLKAEIIYSFSGFVYLDKEICSDPLNPKLALAEANPNQKKWLDIREIIRKSKSEIFFFYPFYSEADRKQVASIQSCSNITFIPIDSDIHGIGPSGKLYASLFSFKYKLFKRKIQKKNRKLSISELDDLIEFNRNYIQQFAGIMKQLRQSIYRRINFFKIL